MKKIYYTAVCALIIYSFTACKPALFKTVRVKTEPTLRVNLGSKEFKTEDYLSAKLINKNSDDDEFKQKFRTFDYRLPDGTLGILLHYPITEIDLDIAKELDSLKELEKAFNSSLEKKEFGIPSVNKEEQKTITAEEIGSKLLEAVNKAITGVSFPALPNTGGLAVTYPPVDVSLNLGSSFKTMTFKQGSEFELNIEPAGSVQIEQLVLKRTDGSEIAKGNSASVDISDKELPNELKLVLTVKNGSGNPQNLKPQLKGGIKKAVGVTLNDIEIPVSGLTVPLSASASVFQEALIKTGSLEVKTAKNGMDGFNLKYEMKAKQDPGFDVSVTNDNPAQSLNGKTVSGKDITVNGNVKLTASNALFSNEGGESISLNFKFAVEEFTVVKLKLDNNFQTSQKISPPIPPGLKAWVKEVKFNKVGAEVTIDNRLPEGNDLSVAVKSNTFDITSTETFPASETQPVTKFFRKSPLLFEPSKKSVMDFEADLKLSEYDSSSKTFKLKNIKPGQKVSISGNIKLDLDWEYIIVQPKGNAGAFSGAYPAKEADTLNLSKFNKYRDLGFKMNEIKAYLFVSADIFNQKSAEIQTNMYIQYKNETDADMYEYLVGKKNGNDIEFEKMNFVDPLPKVFSRRGKNAPAVYSGSIPQASKEVELTDLVNKAPKGVKLRYNLKINEIKIEKKQVEDAKKAGHTKMKADLLIAVPMDFDLNSKNNEPYVKIEHFGNKGDIFGRTKRDRLKLNRFLDITKQISLNFDYNNTTGAKVKAIVFDKNNKDKFTREIMLDSGQKTAVLALTPEDITHLRSTVPLNLDIDIVMPVGRYKIRQNSQIAIKAYFAADVDIDKNIKL